MSSERRRGETPGAGFSGARSVQAVASDSVPFERYQGGHVITVPAIVGDSTPTRLALDTGIGVNVVSAGLCRRLGFVPTGGTYSGRRMSGQRISAPLTRVSSISVDSLRQENIVAGMFDLNAFFPEGSGIEGFLSPQFFEPWPFALNSLTKTVRIDHGEPGPIRPHAVEVPLTIQRDGPSVELFVDLRLPGGAIATVEVDTGSDDLILDTRFMKELGVDADRADVRKATGTDETGHQYARYFTHLHGPVSLAAAPSIGQRNPAVMFQKIIYDGLLGDAFLRSFDVTFDLAGRRLLFADPSL